MVTSTLDAKGGVITGEFAKWTADQQRDIAFTLKQQRLYAEEEVHADKRAASQPQGGKKK